MRVARIKRLYFSENGSASVEFVALALPLFLPIFIFLNQFAAVSNQEEIARTLAREGARAFVTTPNGSNAEVVMNSVIQSAGAALGLNRSEFQRLAVGLECSHSPCFSPSARVIVTIHFAATAKLPAITASAQEYISPWS